MSNTIENSFMAKRVIPSGFKDLKEPGILSKLLSMLLFALALVAGGVLFLILVSYDATDPGFSRFSTTGHVSNIFGFRGAWAADLIYLLFGWGSWILLFGSLFLLVRSFQNFRGRLHESHKWPMFIRLAAFFVLLVSGCTLFFLRFHSYGAELPGTTGGALGSAVGSELLYSFGLYESTALTVLLIFICSSVFLGFSWLRFFELIGGAVEFLFGGLKSRHQKRLDEAVGQASLRLREEHLSEAPVPEPSFVSDPSVSDPRMAASFGAVQPQPQSLGYPAAPKEKAAAYTPSAHASEYAAPLTSASEASYPAVSYGEEAEPAVNATPLQEDASFDEIKGISSFSPIQASSILTPEKGGVFPQEEEEKAESSFYVEENANLAPMTATEEAAPVIQAAFELPSISLLNQPPFDRVALSQDELSVTCQRIEHILQNYKINAKVKSAVPGPIITQFRVEPGVGVKSSKFIGVAKDLARGLGQMSVRVIENLGEAGYLGLEVPNPPQSKQTIHLKEVIASHAFQSNSSPLTLALGKNTLGSPEVIDLAKAPHLLVAGTTGSGKSVGVNAMILSMLYKNSPDRLRLILIDPKEVEFCPYDNIPHLLTPVITEMDKAARSLNWAVKEMDRRYKLMKSMGVRNFEAFNELVRQGIASGTPHMNKLLDPPAPLEEIPYIIIIIDELADLLLAYRKQVENQIMRLAQKARAAGMHLILATQRPSADIVTPVIKANCPTRISFQVSNRFDSQTILNSPGAEELLGSGDMFVLHPGRPMQRVHGAYVADDEIRRVTEFIKAQRPPQYVDGVTDEEEQESEGSEEFEGTGSSQESNELYDKAVEIVVTENRPSISYIQRRLGIGYNRAANLIELMEKDGLISKASGAGKRVVLKRPEI